MLNQKEVKNAKVETFSIARAKLLSTLSKTLTWDQTVMATLLETTTGATKTVLQKYKTAIDDSEAAWELIKCLSLDDIEMNNILLTVAKGI